MDASTFRVLHALHTFGGEMESVHLQQASGVIAQAFARLREDGLIERAATKPVVKWRITDAGLVALKESLK